MSMSLPTGKGSDGKIIKYKMPETEGSELLFYLTNRQRGLLLQNIEYLRWMKRYTRLPDGWTQDELDEFVDELALRLMMIVEFCSQVINCINDDQDTINALNNYLINQLRINSELQQAVAEAAHPYPGDEQHTPYDNVTLYRDGLTCTRAGIAGQMVALVQWMNQNNVDFLERMAQAATPASRAAVMGELIPGFIGGTIGMAVSEALTYMAGAFKTNYEAFYDATYEEALIEELICLAEKHCSLTVKQLYVLFLLRIGYHPIGIDAFIQAFTFAFTGEVTGYQGADMMMFLQVGAFRFMGGFVGWRGLNPLVQQITAGDEFPTNDYDSYDCPDDWESDLNFKEDDYGFSIVVQGEWQLGIGFVDTYYQFIGGNGYRGLNITLTLALPANIRFASLKFRYVPGIIGDTNDATCAMGNELSEYIILDIEPEVPISPREAALSLTYNTINISLLCGMIANTTADPGGTAVLESAHFEGLGTKPAEFP